MKNFFTHKMRKKSPIEIIGIIIFGGIAITGLAILFGFIIMWLWNWLMPDVFGLPELTYWKAVGLFILSKLFLGGCGMGSSHKECKNSGSHKKPKKDFSKWEHYDKFWEEEGDKLYKEYIDKKYGGEENEEGNS